MDISFFFIRNVFNGGLVMQFSLVRCCRMPVGVLLREIPVRQQNPSVMSSGCHQAWALVSSMTAVQGRSKTNV